MPLEGSKVYSDDDTDKKFLVKFTEKTVKRQIKKLRKISLRK